MRQHEEVCDELAAAKKTIRELRSLLSRNGIPIPNNLGEDDDYPMLKLEAAPEETPVRSTTRRGRKRTRTSRAIEADATEALLDQDLDDSALEIASREDFDDLQPSSSTLRRVPSGSDVTNHFESGLTRDPSLRLERDASQGSGFFKDLQLSRESSWNKHIDRWAEQMVSDELIAGQVDGVDDFNFPDPEVLLAGTSGDTVTEVVLPSRVVIKQEPGTAPDSKHFRSQPMTCAAQTQAAHRRSPMPLVAASGAA